MRLACLVVVLLAAASAHASSAQPSLSDMLAARRARFSPESRIQPALVETRAATSAELQAKTSTADQMCANILRFFYPGQNHGNRVSFTEAQVNHCLCMYYSAVKKQDLFDRVPRPPRAGRVTLSYARQTLARMAGITGQSPEGTFSTAVKNAVALQYRSATDLCFQYGQNSMCASECKWLRCYNHFNNKYLKVPGEHCKRTTRFMCGSDSQCTPDSSDGKTGCQTGNVCLCGRHRINECQCAWRVPSTLANRCDTDGTL